MIRGDKNNSAYLHHLLAECWPPRKEEYIQHGDGCAYLGQFS